MNRNASMYERSRSVLQLHKYISCNKIHEFSYSVRKCILEAIKDTYVKKVFAYVYSKREHVDFMFDAFIVEV